MTSHPLAPPKRTVPVCPECRRNVVLVDDRVPKMPVFRCQGCGHRWATVASHQAGGPTDAQKYRRANKKPWRLPLVAVGVLLLAAAAGAFATTIAQRLMPPPPSEIPLEVLERTASNVNRDLPRMVAPDTELTSVEASESLLTYHHRLVDLQAQDLEPSFMETLRPGVLRAVCSTRSLRDAFLESGVTLRWTYHDRDRRHVATIEVAPPDCGL